MAAKKTATAPKAAAQSEEKVNGGRHDLNSVNLQGRIGTDIELRTSDGGKKFLTFNLAVSDRGRKTSWVKVVCFEGLAEFQADRLEKGQRITLKGKLESSNFEREDGTKASSLSVIAHEICW